MSTRKRATGPMGPKTTKAEPAPTPALSWRQLAAELETTDRSLRTWRAMPDAPQGPDVDAWRRFIGENALGRPRSGEVAELRAELLREQIATAKRRNQREAGDLIPKDALQEVIVDRATRFARLMRYEMEQNLPPLLVGQPIVQIRLELRDACDRISTAYNAPQYHDADEIAAAATGTAATGEATGEAEN
jgi:hypothetical protein